MPRYKVIIEYLGTGLAGFQKQKYCIAIQELLEAAISQFTNEAPAVFAAGRTDAGVHALGQVAHFDLVKKYESYVVTRAINHFLKPYQISVLDTEIVDEDFHARFSAKARHYLYRVNNRSGEVAIDKDRVWWVRPKLDIRAMVDASQYLLGKHDFTSFRASACQSSSPVKTLSKLDVVKVGDEIHFILSAPSFLHHMVRNIVGTLVLVGSGKWQPEDVRIALEAKNRTAAGPTAPAWGLYFTKVDY